MTPNKIRRLSIFKTKKEEKIILGLHSGPQMDMKRATLGLHLVRESGRPAHQSNC